MDSRRLAREDGPRGVALFIRLLKLTGNRPPVCVRPQAQPASILPRHMVKCRHADERVFR